MTPEEVAKYIVDRVPQLKHPKAGVHAVVVYGSGSIPQVVPSYMAGCHWVLGDVKIYEDQVGFSYDTSARPSAYLWWDAKYECVSTSLCVPVYVDEAREFAKYIGTLASRRRMKWTIASTTEDDGYHTLGDHTTRVKDLEMEIESLEERNRLLQFMVDNGLGEEDML